MTDALRALIAFLAEQIVAAGAFDDAPAPIEDHQPEPAEAPAES